MPTIAQPFFDYTLAMHNLCRDICSKVQEFRLFDPDKIGYSFVNTRSPSKGGVLASMSPLRFEDGRCVAIRERVWTIRKSRNSKETEKYVEQVYVTFPEIIRDGIKIMYIFNFSGSRFIDLPFREKLNTIMHELYHIHPSFNGLMRRFPGRNYKHGNQKQFDATAAKFADEWLASKPDESLYDFLKYDMKSASEKLGRLGGTMYKQFNPYIITKEEAMKLEPSLFAN